MNPTASTTTGTYRLTEAEIETAFSYCDVQGTGRVTAAGLKARLGPLLLGGADSTLLLGGKAALTLPELKAVQLAPPTAAPTTKHGSQPSGTHARTPTPVPTAGVVPKGRDAVAEAFGLMADRTGHIGRDALAQWLRAVDFVTATERELEYVWAGACEWGDLDAS